MSTFFSGIFDTTATASIGVSSFLLAVFTAIAIGIGLAIVYSYREKTTKSFLLCLAMLPAIVAVVIMMVNGNVGAGVAVAGAFSLVRFRSVPGTAKEIAAIFLAMGTGLICGMGYLGYAILFAAILAAGMFIFTAVTAGKADRYLMITVPEDLDYSGAFEDIFANYLTNWEAVNVKTTNMGSLFKLKYRITMKNAADEKRFIDDLRTKNGNLEVAIAAADNSLVM